MGHGRRRDSAYTQNEGRNRKNHMKENGSNQRDLPAERGGRTCPETRTLYRSRAPAGRKNAGRQSGRLKAVNQGSDKAHKNPVSKMRCRAAKEML
ncbi:hypothetical protein TNCV_2162511 [Trichonephila clavipes]|nr:hypothetical protein TNCV_2162511 [Trichonephila clavipes]